MIETRHGPKPRTNQPSNPVKPMQFKGIPTRKLSDFPSLRSLKPTLSYIKVHHPSKGYKLIWEFMGHTVYCEENQITYRKVGGKGGVVEAGEMLANLLGVKFNANSR